MRRAVFFRVFCFFCLRHYDVRNMSRRRARVVTDFQTEEAGVNLRRYARRCARTLTGNAHIRVAQTRVLADRQSAALAVFARSRRRAVYATHYVRAPHVRIRRCTCTRTTDQGKIIFSQFKLCRNTDGSVLSGVGRAAVYRLFRPAKSNYTVLPPINSHTARGINPFPPIVLHF